MLLKNLPLRKKERALLMLAMFSLALGNLAHWLLKSHVDTADLAMGACYGMTFGLWILFIRLRRRGAC
jgi:hypothetical protein